MFAADDNEKKKKKKPVAYLSQWQMERIDH